MFNPPCKNCKNRKIPKTCETTCELWQTYYQKKQKEQEIIKTNKKMHKLKRKVM